MTTLYTELLFLIKKKKMWELENLLNSLIKRGWKPWGEKSKKIIIRASRIFVYNSEWYINPEGKHIRSIVSLESQLWQFVCQNKLLSDKVDLQDYLEDSYWFRRCPFDTNWMYRIMQSALYSEKDLPQFLIDNIKVE